MRLAGKRFLVTGATGGIGAAVSLLLATQGARLLLTATRQNHLDQLASILSADTDVVTADLSTSDGRERVLAACRSGGGIDGVVNLAGVQDFGLFSEQSEAMIAKTLTTNLLAPVLLCRELLPLLLEKPEAMILNVGSIFGSIGHPGFVSYCTSKAGIKSFTEALARELADTRVHVAYIAPRATATAMNGDRVNALNAALGNKADSPEFVAREIVRMMQGRRRLRYLGWPEKLFVGINAVLPDVVHRSLVRNLPLIKKYATQGKSL